MADEDRKTLLFLCDDIIRHMMKYMTVTSHIRHSRTCTDMYQVADQWLLTVKSLEKDWTPETKSQLKTGDPVTRTYNVQNLRITREKDLF